MKLLTFTAFSILIPQFLFGQQTDENIVPGDFPPGPCCNPAPSYSSWTVDIKYGDEDASNDKSSTGNNAKRAVSYFVEKTNDTIHEKITDNAGSQIEKWYVGEQQYTKRGGHYYQAAGTDITNMDFEYLPTSGFLGLDWVSKSNFVGVEKSGDQTFLVFKDKRTIGSVFGPPPSTHISGISDIPVLPDLSPPVEVTAWINEETRLPAKLQVDKQIRSFTFLAAPTAQIKLPSELTALVDQAKKIWQKITRAAPQPF